MQRLPQTSLTVAIDPASNCSSLQIIYNRAMATPDTTTVRIRRPDSERLSEVAKRRSTTVVDVLHTAIEALERQDFLRGLTADVQQLSPAEREALFAERLAWDNLA
jgi:hypothetical protein